MHEKSIIAIVTVIVTDFLAFVFSDTQENESQEYQIFVREFRRKIGVCVYNFLCVKKRGGKEQGTFLTEKAIRLLEEYNTYQDILAQTVYDKTFWEVIGMKISARNQLKGKITEIEKEGLIAKVRIAVEPATITAVITKEAAEALGLRKDDKVIAVVKSTEVMIGKE